MKKNYEVGRGKPPKHTQFKKGVCANPLGRGKKKDPGPFSDIMEDILNKKMTYTEGGKLKRASTIELLIKKLAASAVKGDVSSAASLLKIRQNAVRGGTPGPITIRVINALPNDLPYENW